MFRDRWARGIFLGIKMRFIKSTRGLALRDREFSTVECGGIYWEGSGEGTMQRSWFYCILASGLSHGNPDPVGLLCKVGVRLEMVHSFDWVSE